MAINANYSEGFTFLSIYYLPSSPFFLQKHVEEAQQKIDTVLIIMDLRYLEGRQTTQK